MKEQIEEMANIMKMSLDGLGSGTFNFTGFEISTMFAKALYNASYRKVPEGAMILTRAELDALNKYQERFKGQDAKAVIATEVAREIIAAADEIINTICVMTGIEIAAVGGKYLGLRKKYTVTDTNDGCKYTGEGK